MAANAAVRLKVGSEGSVELTHSHSHTLTTRTGRQAGRKKNKSALRSYTHKTVEYINGTLRNPHSLLLLPQN